MYYDTLANDDPCSEIVVGTPPVRSENEFFRGVQVLVSWLNRIRAKKQSSPGVCERLVFLQNWGHFLYLPRVFFSDTKYPPTGANVHSKRARSSPSLLTLCSKTCTKHW